MTDAIVFDSHRFVRNLTASGFTERQAEALANEQVQLLNANLATKADLAAVRSDLAAVRSYLEAKITGVQADLQVKIANVKSDLLKWMFAAFVAQGGVIATLITLL